MKRTDVMSRAEAMDACLPLFKWFQSQGIEGREACLIMAAGIVAINYGMANETKRPMKDAKKGAKIICDIITEMMDDLISFNEHVGNDRPPGRA